MSAILADADAPVLPPVIVDLHDIENKIDDLKDVILRRGEDGIFVISDNEIDNNADDEDDEEDAEVDAEVDGTPSIRITGCPFISPFMMAFEIEVRIRGPNDSEPIYFCRIPMPAYLRDIAEGRSLEPQDELRVNVSSFILGKLNDGSYNNILQKYYPDIHPVA